MNIEIVTLSVYRLRREKYYSERDEYIEKTIYSGSKEHISFQHNFHKRTPVIKQQYENHLRHKYGGCWKYNEIIGFIKLHFLGRQIRGEYFRVKAERILKTRKKTFEYITHKLAPERSIEKSADNEKTYKIIKGDIEDFYKELQRGQFIDDGHFCFLGYYVDWRKLLESRV